MKSRDPSVSLWRAGVFKLRQTDGKQVSGALFRGVWLLTASLLVCVAHCQNTAERYMHLFPIFVT